MIRKLSILAAAATALSAAVPAQRQSSATPTAASASTVSIPFAPPIGVLLRYRIAKTTFGPAERSVTLEFTARFERAGEGYRMTVAYQLPAPVRSGAADPALVFLQRPLTLRLGGDGTLVAIEDEQAYWAGVEALLERMVAQDGPETPGGREAMRRIIADMRGLPDEARIEKLAENFMPVIAMTGTELTIGAPLRWTGQTATIFGPMTSDVTVSLDRVEGGIAYVSATTTVPREEMERAMRAMFARIVPPGTGRAIPQDFRFHSVENSESSEVAIETGLARRYRAARTVDVEAEGQRQRGGTIFILERIE
ncbi:MAG TPA: hypothetical protein VF577_00535 [Allosphingosinicella sp.]